MRAPAQHRPQSALRRCSGNDRRGDGQGFVVLQCAGRGEEDRSDEERPRHDRRGTIVEVRRKGPCGEAHRADGEQRPHLDARPAGPSTVAATPAICIGRGSKPSRLRCRLELHSTSEPSCVRISAWVVNGPGPHFRSTYQPSGRSGSRSPRSRLAADRSLGLARPGLGVGGRLVRRRPEIWLLRAPSEGCSATSVVLGLLQVAQQDVDHLPAQVEADDDPHQVDVLGIGRQAVRGHDPPVLPQLG